MIDKPARGNGRAMSAETMDEVHDGIALGLDALNALGAQHIACGEIEEHIVCREIEEAKGHLRFAQRQLRDLIDKHQNGA